LGAAIYALVCGGGMVVWVSSAVFALLLVWYAFFVMEQIENQINFSVRPLGDKKTLVGVFLAILICVSFGLGYFNEATVGKYAIPPKAREYVTETVFKTLEKTVEDQMKVQTEGQKLSKKQQAELDKQKQDAITKAKDELKKTLDDAEKQLLPYKNYVAVTLGVLAFFVFQTLFFVLLLLLSPMFLLVFFVMKLTRFTNEEAEKVEVKRLKV